MVRSLVSYGVVGFLIALARSRGSESDSLRMVLALFRHGARSPITTFPTDPHADYPWIGGMEALQPLGIKQLYKLGTNMRKRYRDFIPEDNINMKQSIYAVSGCSDRCIDSAQSLLTGFLQTSNSSEIIRQPVPLHVIPPDQDTFILQNKTCPKLKTLSKQLKLHPSSELASWYLEGSALVKLVSKLIGAPIASQMSLAMICDSLEVYHMFGLKQPGWAYQVFPERARAFILGYLLSYTSTTELKHILGGAIVTEFLTKMRAKRDGTMVHNRRIFFYSGHDLTQINLFNSMGMKEQIARRPECGSAVVFELHSNRMFGQDLEVRMFHYVSPTESIPLELRIPNCAAPCSLTNFEKTVQHLLLDDFDEVCWSW